MELSEVILALVSIISAGLIGVMRTIHREVTSTAERLTACQLDMHDRFLQKSEFHEDISELKEEIRDQRKIIDQIWKSIGRISSAIPDEAKK